MCHSLPLSVNILPRAWPQKAPKAYLHCRLDCLSCTVTSQFHPGQFLVIGVYRDGLTRSTVPRLTVSVTLRIAPMRDECNTSLRCLSPEGYFFRSDLRSQLRLDFAVFNIHQLLRDQTLLQQDFPLMTS